MFHVQKVYDDQTFNFSVYLIVELISIALQELTISEIVAKTWNVFEIKDITLSRQNNCSD